MATDLGPVRATREKKKTCCHKYWWQKCQKEKRESERERER